MIFAESVQFRTVRRTDEERLFAYTEDPLLATNSFTSAEDLSSPSAEQNPASVARQFGPIVHLIANGTDNMFLVEQKGMQAIPLEGFLPMLLLSLSVSFIVVGGAIPYVFQYAEIYRRKSAAGFSLLVCLALCVANILRIEFWFGKKFEIPLLVQSVVMILVMIGMLEISVRMNRRMVPVTQRTSIWNGDFVEDFWKWNDLSSFLVSLLLFAAIVTLFNGIFYQYSYFVEALGMSALLVEACLGVPQLVRNFQRKSTVGMSVKMVFMWFIGDVGKTIYFVVRASPAQFWICSCLQITIDVLILLQVWLYGHRTSDAHQSRIPSYVSSSTTSKI